MSQAAADRLLAEAAAALAGGTPAAAARAFEQATRLMPTCAPAWKGLGEVRLGLGQPAAAARAFDRAIGLRPDSATALWGGALAHAELGRALMARFYLQRALALQPSWIEMARTIAQLQGLLTITARVAEVLRAALGPMSTKRLRHAELPDRSIEVGRVVDLPSRGTTTYVTVGLCEHAWADPASPRLELVLASNLPLGPSSQILANAAFHLMAGPLPPRPGALIEGLVGALAVPGLSERLPHLYLAEPVPWRLPTPVDAGPPSVAILQAVPVSEPERALWRAGGADELERRLGEAGTDIADLERTGALSPA
ncbi:MAG: suppressor of fused domain protein [Kofleriaceae bacterium]